MKKFNDIILEKKEEEKYEYRFDGNNMGYVVDKETNMILVYSHQEAGQDFLKEAVEKMNQDYS